MSDQSIPQPDQSNKAETNLLIAAQALQAIFENPAGKLNADQANYVWFTSQSLRLLALDACLTV
jgi:hypothetical protein